MRESNGYEQRTAHFNKMMYLKSFGVRFELPTAHVIGSAVFARQPNYIYQVIKYILPSERRTNMSISPTLPLYEEINREGNILVRLQRQGEGSSLYDVQKDGRDAYVIIKKARKPKICFSADGSMFAYMVMEERGLTQEQKVSNIKGKIESKIKNFMQTYLGKGSYSRYDPKDEAYNQYNSLQPVLAVVKSHSTDPYELIDELRLGQDDERNFLVKIDLSKNGFDEETLAQVQSM